MLSLSNYGAVPIHFKTYSGNRTDDTTHITTWCSVRRLTGKSDFLYVADCKVCTRHQLGCITRYGGRVVTLQPETWREVKQFKSKLRETLIPKRRILRKPVSGCFDPKKFESFYCFQGSDTTQKDGKGRPGKHTQYITTQTNLYSLLWSRNRQALQRERRVDGIFSLLSTDDSLSAKESVLAYKFQPRLEKRFQQLKSVHLVAPTLCKKVERVEALMFLYFVALIIQAIVERTVRQRMEKNTIDAIPIYPEHRGVNEFPDPLNPTQLYFKTARSENAKISVLICAESRI